MVAYESISIVRTDGQFKIITKSGDVEMNQPTQDQLDDTPDAHGMISKYRPLDSGETKALDWRRKLGGMLVQLLGGQEHAGKNYILGEFPEGYALWEHSKYHKDGTAYEKKHKSKHAAGGHERQDAYLYGHPQGRKKRYRSPADFFPHLLWLACDAEGDNMNCSCKICSPDGDEDTHVGNAKVELKKEPKPLHTTKLQNGPPKPPSQNPIAFAAKPLLQAPKPPPQAPQHYPSAEQQLDTQSNVIYLYRPGELVWFARASGQGLCVIQKRRVFDNKPQYMLQPLSNPVMHPPYEIRDKEDTIRPFLAWSVPDPPNLKEYQNMSYEQVPWERHVRGDFGESNFEIDGSIFAAKAIDISYSLFGRIATPAAQGEQYYSGMFLGAEKLWSGEPVRLRGYGSDSVVLVIDKLIERITPPSISTVIFIGDIYKFVEMPTPYKSRSEWPTPNLPPRMVTDLRYRNEVSDNAQRGIWHEWRLLEPAARKGLIDVKGRWYESRTMMPILASHNLQEFQQNLTRGFTTDVDTMMNGTGDGSTALRQRKKNRRETLGGAVSPEFKVSRGLDGPPADDMFPEIQRPLPPQQSTDIDQFVDFE